jgi:hypothetical protein
MAQKRFWPPSTGAQTSWSVLVAYVAVAFPVALLVGLVTGRNMSSNVVTALIVSLGAAAGGTYLRVGAIRDERWLGREG